MSEKLRIYLSGKVTGLDYEHTVEKFQAAEDTIMGAYLNVEVVNPMKIVPKGTIHEKAMNICLHKLEDCRVICMLPDWVDSTGARMEHHHATINNIIDISFDELNIIESIKCG